MNPSHPDALLAQNSKPRRNASAEGTQWPKPEQGYHLTEDLVDDAISWINRQQSIAPDKPYFMYFSTGGTHSPLHVPEEWIAKFKGKFDQGWDAVRKETIHRQKKLGVVPQDTVLTPRPKQIPGWDTLSADQ